MITEYRQTRRFLPSVVVVRFEHPTNGERVNAFVWDLSLGGLFLETDALVETDALLALTLKLRDGDMPVDARVAWSRAEPDGDDAPRGMAVRFIDLPDDVAFAIRGVLHEGLPEKTVLGVGAERTQADAPAPKKAERVGRQTVIGVAPPANLPEKPRLVLSDTSLPAVEPSAPSSRKPLAKPPVPTPAKAIVPEPIDVALASEPPTIGMPAARPAAVSEQNEDSALIVPLVKPRRRIGRWVLAFGIAAGGAALFLHRDALRTNVGAVSRAVQASMASESAPIPATPTTITSATPPPVASETPPPVATAHPSHTPPKTAPKTHKAAPKPKPKPSR
jgi:hypothetical protein